MQTITTTDTKECMNCLRECVHESLSCRRWNDTLSLASCLSLFLFFLSRHRRPTRTHIYQGRQRKSRMIIIVVETCVGSINNLEEKKNTRHEIDTKIRLDWGIYFQSEKKEQEKEEKDYYFQNRRAKDDDSK